MRQFIYSTNGGAELKITVTLDNNALFEACFPTPAALKEFFEKDINMYLSNQNLANLTNDEVTSCRNLIKQHHPD